MAYRYGQERNQMLLFPQSIDQYVAEDHPVRAYDAFVDTLNFNELGIELDARKVGNSQYDPRLMLKLLLYAYCYGLKGSRKIERATHENIAFIWLMKNLKPDHKTIAEFRRKNKNALKSALKLCARLCLKMGLIQGNILFVDSTKLRAYAGKKHQHRKKWYQKQLKIVEQRIHELLAECEQIDQDQAEQGSWVKMPKELAEQKRLKATIQSALDEFKNRGTHTKNGQERQVNRMDPDSTLMHSPQGTHPGYSVQSVVDDQNGLIVHTDAVSDANDSNQLAKQVKAAEKVLDKDCQVACADAGYADIEQMEKIESDKTRVIVPSKQQISTKPPKPFSKSEFVYDKEHDCYRCPQGQRLIFRRFKNKQRVKGNYRIEKPAICRACEHFGACTSSKQGRTITRHICEDLKEKIEQRFEQGECRHIYERRKARVEHPFGYIKKVLGFGQFSLKGLQSAQAEAAVVATCFNLTRMINLLGGVKGFIARLQAV